jgi:hypothetical protein
MQQGLVALSAANISPNLGNPNLSRIEQPGMASSRVAASFQDPILQRVAALYSSPQNYLRDTRSVTARMFRGAA